MKLVSAVIAATFIFTACSNQQDSDSAVNEAETKQTSANVKHDKPQKINLTKYDISHGSTAPMKISIDSAIEEGCWQSANWRLKKLDNGDYFVTVEMLAHPAIVCIPNMIKKHQLGVEIAIPTSTSSDQHARVWVQRLTNDSAARSVVVTSEKETTEVAEILEERIDAQSHFISIMSPKGFTAFVDYKRVRDCGAEYFYSSNNIDENTLFVERTPARRIGIPCLPNMLKTFYTGLKLDVASASSVNYKNIIVMKQKHEAAFPIVSARKIK